MRINLGRFVMALLFTLVVCALVAQAQAQTNYNGWTASAHERTIKAELWDRLFAYDFDCILPPTEEGEREWCGAIYDDLVDVNQRIVQRVFQDHGYISLNDNDIWDTTPLTASTDMLSIAFTNFRYGFVVFYIPLDGAGYIQLVTILSP